MNFNRSWSDYETGFGDMSAEHWLGNTRLSGFIHSKHPLSLKEACTTFSDFRVSCHVTVVFIKKQVDDFQ